MRRHTYDSCTCVSGITYNSLKIWKNCTSNTPFLRKIKTWNMSSKKTRDTISCLLLMYLPHFFCAPRAAARGTALRAVKVLTFHQILLEPLCSTHLDQATKLTRHPWLSIRFIRKHDILRELRKKSLPLPSWFLTQHLHLWSQDMYDMTWFANTSRTLQDYSSLVTRHTYHSTTVVFEHIELPAKLLDYFLRSNKSNINQSAVPTGLKA